MFYVCVLCIWVCDGRDLPLFYFIFFRGLFIIIEKKKLVEEKRIKKNQLKIKGLVAYFWPMWPIF
jgi:hypothetical protein